MFRKRCMMILCVLLVCLTIGGTAMAAKDAPIKIYIDGELVAGAGEALMVDDSTVYVPLRDICEYYGGKVLWDEKTQLVRISLEGTQIETYLWSRVVEANGRMLYDESPSVLVHDRFMIPARVLAKALNGSVRWDEQRQSVFFTSGSAPLESGESYYQQDDVYWLSRIIDAEAGNQPLEGKIGVGNVVLNRVESGSFADSVYQVIFERGQFCPAGNGAIYRTPGAESVLAAKLALEGASTVGEALFFQNTAITGNNWMSRTRPVVAELGNHTFYA